MALVAPALKAEVDVETTPSAERTSAAVQPVNAVDEPDNVFSPARTTLIITIASLTSLVSPFTASIVLPALPAIATDLGVTVGRVNLSVFIFMVGQGISPLFLTGSDALGRRTIYMICFLLYSSANIGLANLPNRDFAGLMVLRFMQACGSASMIALGAGVVNDVCTPKNRGSMMSIVTAGSTIGPAVAPVLGGVLTHAFGWRGLFWFCFALGVSILALTAVFLPETVALARANLSIPFLVRTAWVDLCTERNPKADTTSPRHRTEKMTFSEGIHRFSRACWTPIRTLRVIKQPEIALALAIYALPYACFYGLITPLADQLEQHYGLTTLQSGLVFLSTSAGVTLSTIASGQLLDRSFRKLRSSFDATWEQQQQQQQQHHEILADGSTNAQTTNHTDSTAPPQPIVASQITKAEVTAFYPLEQARLEFYPLWTVMLVAGFLGYGWTMRSGVHISAPIIFIFLAGAGYGGQTSIMATMLVDYVGGRGASITAVNNLTRCLVGAVFSAICQDIINAVGIGWTETIFTAISSLAAVLVVVLLKHGSQWRRTRYMAKASKTKNAMHPGPG